MAPSHGCWQKAFIADSCQVDLSIGCPQDMAAGFPHSKWSEREREQGGIHNAGRDLVLEVTYCHFCRILLEVSHYARATFQVKELRLHLFKGKV